MSAFHFSALALLFCFFYIVLFPRRSLSPLLRVLSLSLTYNGQRCTALKILFVHESLAERFVTLIAAAVDALKIGLPWAQGTGITPLPDPGKPQYLDKVLIGKLMMIWMRARIFFVPLSLFPYYLIDAVPSQIFLSLLVADATSSSFLAFSVSSLFGSPFRAFHSLSHVTFPSSF